jgi:hypothetical protein
MYTFTPPILAADSEVKGRKATRGAGPGQGLERHAG